MLRRYVLACAVAGFSFSHFPRSNAQRIKDLSLDAPKAQEVFESALKQFKATSALPADYSPNEDEPDNTSPEAKDAIAE